LSEGDSYGYAIIKRVQELSGGRMEWTDGMLYPVLHRLERLGYIKARWEEAESGRRRKYYRITPQGKTQLAEERRQWQAVDATLKGIWKAISIFILDCRKIIAEAQRSRRSAERKSNVGTTLCETLRPPRLCDILFQDSIEMTQGA
jgi:DNA-binding PadR family transcriptional regulator